MTTGFDAELLDENLRCKVIYYSCINPHTISDLNESWGYGSPTYLYQDDSLDKLKDADLLTVEKSGGKNILRSNYDALFGADNVARSRAHINREILREFLIHSKGFHSDTGEPADRNDMLSIARGNLDDGLEANLRRIEFDADDFESLVAFWEHDVFREAFLSLETTARLFRDEKSGLPSNPMNYLFKLTAGIMEAIGRSRNESRMELPVGLRYRAEKVIIPAYRRLKQEHAGDDGYDEFVARMNDTYSLFRTRFQADRFNYDFIDDFTELTMQAEKDRKFGKLFQKYRGDGRLL